MDGSPLCRKETLFFRGQQERILGTLLEIEVENKKVVLKPKVLVDKAQAWEGLNRLMRKVVSCHRKISEKEGGKVL